MPLLSFFSGPGPGGWLMPTIPGVPNMNPAKAAALAEMASEGAVSEAHAR